MDPIARAKLLAILADMTAKITAVNQTLESSNQRSMKIDVPSSEPTIAQPLVQPYNMCGLQLTTD